MEILILGQENLFGCKKMKNFILVSFYPKKISFLKKLSKMPKPEPGSAKALSNAMKVK